MSQSSDKIKEISDIPEQRASKV